MCGCVSVDKYPDQWDALDGGVRSEICPKLSGIYDNTGVTAGGKHVLLALWLSEITDHDAEFPLEMRDQLFKDLYAATTVQIGVTDNQTLAIKVTGEGVDREWTVPKERIECKTNSISVHGNGLAGGAGGFYAGTRFLDLYRSSNRLVLNQMDRGVVVLVFVPIVGYENHWASFPLIREE